MKLNAGPHPLKIGPHTYDVLFVPDVDEVLERDEELFGHINHKTGELHVGLNMHGLQQADTLLHEALHGVLVQIGRDDETLVHGLAPGLLNLLRSNPWFVNFLLRAKQ